MVIVFFELIYEYHVIKISSYMIIFIIDKNLDLNISVTILFSEFCYSLHNKNKLKFFYCNQINKTMTKY